MTEIPDSLRLLYETRLEKDGDRYVLPIPAGVVEDSSLTTDAAVRAAILSMPSTQSAADESAASSTPDRTTDRAESRDSQNPPVERGEVRTVTIDTLGDQGDGIAKVERGFILIVPDTRPGDRVEIEVTDVKDSVAFAEPISEPEVR